MSKTTGIEWADHTASPWHGCQHALMSDGTEHPGCLNCYAERMAKRNPKILGEWGPDGTRVISKSFVEKCRRWNKDARREGVRHRVFPSMCDPFEDGDAMVIDQDGFAIVPDGELQRIGQRELTRQMLELADECPWLDFVLLTKRPQKVRTNWTEYAWSACATGDCSHETQDECDADKSRRYRDNVWLMASVSDQQTADEMIPHLLACRDLVPVLGLSIEPLLGPIDLRMWINQLDWVIIGGES